MSDRGAAREVFQYTNKKTIKEVKEEKQYFTIYSTIWRFSGGCDINITPHRTMMWFFKTSQIYSEIIKHMEREFSNTFYLINEIIDHGSINPNECKADGKEYSFEVIALYPVPQKGWKTTSITIKGPHSEYHGTNEFLLCVKKEIVGMMETNIIIQSIQRVK